MLDEELIALMDQAVEERCGAWGPRRRTADLLTPFTVPRCAAPGFVARWSATQRISPSRRP
jgi:hypothetical protein